jgi:hypothetical protein
MNSIAKVTVALCALLAWHTVFAQAIQPDPKVKLAQGTEGAGAAGTAGGTATGAATTATGTAAGGGLGVGTLAISGAMAATISATSSSGSGTATTHVPAVTHTP